MAGKRQVCRKCICELRDWVWVLSPLLDAYLLDLQHLAFIFIVPRSFYGRTLAEKCLSVMHQGGWVQWVLSTDIAHNYWPMVIRKIKLTFNHFIIVLKFSSDNAPLIICLVWTTPIPFTFP